MRVVACNLCGSQNSKELYPSTLPNEHKPQPGSAFNCTSPDYGQHYRIVKCLDCGFVYANPRSEPGDVLDAYVSVEDPLYLQEQDGRKLTFQKHLKPMHQITGEPNGRRLLDVGAYTGIFVSTANAAGWQAEGIEPSKWGVAQAQQANVPVRQGTLGSGGFTPESFDVITMWDVIEHFDNPRAELDHTYRLLKPGGVLVVHTIDIDSITAKLMGERWPFLMEMHVIFFSRATLRDMMQRTGFNYISDHIEGRYLRMGYLAGRMTAAFGNWIGKPIEKLVSALGLTGAPVPINTLDLFTAYARKPN
jgi:2-polyprenyl-3-methyl-5-hydroxy-6-metoxy-1,4-benzoquinol methylase